MSAALRLTFSVWLRLVVAVSLTQFPTPLRAETKTAASKSDENSHFVSLGVAAVDSPQALTYLLSLAGASEDSMRIVYREVSKSAKGKKFPRAAVEKNELLIAGRPTGVRFTSLNPLRVTYSGNVWTLKEGQPFDKAYLELVKLFARRDARLRLLIDHAQAEQMPAAEGALLGGQAGMILGTVVGVLAGVVLGGVVGLKIAVKLAPRLGLTTKGLALFGFKTIGVASGAAIGAGTVPALTVPPLALAGAAIGAGAAATSGSSESNPRAEREAYLNAAAEEQAETKALAAQANACTSFKVTCENGKSELITSDRIITAREKKTPQDSGLSVKQAADGKDATETNLDGLAAEEVRTGLLNCTDKTQAKGLQDTVQTACLAAVRIADNPQSGKAVPAKEATIQ